VRKIQLFAGPGGPDKLCLPIFPPAIDWVRCLGPHTKHTELKA